MAKKTTLGPKELKRIVELKEQGLIQKNIAEQISKEFGKSVHQAVISSALIKMGLRTQVKTRKRRLKSGPRVTKPKATFASFELVLKNERLNAEDKITLLGLLERGRMLS